MGNCKLSLFECFLICAPIILGGIVAAFAAGNTDVFAPFMHNYLKKDRCEMKRVELNNDRR